MDLTDLNDIYEITLSVGNSEYRVKRGQTLPNSGVVITDIIFDTNFFLETEKRHYMFKIYAYNINEGVESTHLHRYFTNPTVQCVNNKKPLNIIEDENGDFKFDRD